MTLAFAAALGHAPGITAWREAAPTAQRERVEAAFGELRRRLSSARPEALIIFTAEHWANFFLDHMSPYCIGRAPSFTGPIEPWLKIDRVTVPGHPHLATELLNALYARDIEPGFTDEMGLDHGTMVPLHFLTPRANVPIVPVVFNTLAAPLPAPRRCFRLGEIAGEVARASPLRVALIATGGMSHDPGERQHGRIDQAFDREFLDQMRNGNSDRLKQHTTAQLGAAGAGALELVTWIALAGALRGAHGEVLVYEPVVQWATGLGAMAFQVA